MTEKLQARGLRALPQARRPQSPIQRSHVAHMLKNRYYLGYVTFKGVEYPGRHQTLVHQLLFDRVQEVLRDHSNGVKRRKHHHYLKGILYCARCGSRMSFMKANGHGGQYEYFYCIGRQSQRTECKQSFLPVVTVEDAIEAYYGTQRLSEDMQRTIADGLNAEIEYQRKHALPELAYSRRRLEELEKERRRVARGVVDGSVPGDLAVEEYARIDREREQAQQVLAAAEMIYGRNEVDLALALEFVGEVDDVYRRGGPQVRRLCNQFFFSKLLIDGDEIVGSILAEPWSTMYAEDFVNHMARRAAKPTARLSGRGFKIASLVGPAGFEPAF